MVMIPGQVALRKRPAGPSEGLRSRKKNRTHLAIEDAALALFEERGYEATRVEQIAEMAEVSTTTFFRYFPTKADVLLSDHGEQLPALHEGIVARPATENDLVAIQRAFQEHWVRAIDPVRTARKSPSCRRNRHASGAELRARSTLVVCHRHGPRRASWRRLRR